MRKQIIAVKLKLPFSTLIEKYDYYIEGKSTKILSNLTVESALFISDQLLLIEKKRESLQRHSDLFIYNIENKELKHVFERISLFTLLPDKRIIVIYEDIFVKIYDLTVFQKEIKLSGYIREILILPNGKVILYGRKIFIWDLQDEIIQLGDDEYIRSICLFEDKLVTGSQTHQIKIWNLQTLTCETILEGHQETVDNLLVSDKSIISTSLDGQMRIWRDGVCQKTIKSFIDKVLVIEDKIITSFECEKVSINMKVWSVKNGSFLGILKGHNTYISVIEVLPNNQLISGCYSFFKIWDLETLKCVKTIKNSSSPSFIYPFKDVFLTNDRDGLVIYQ